MQLPVFKPTIPPAKFLVSHGAKIRYSDSGKGKVIVLLHGFLESMDMWSVNDFAERLSKKFRVIMIDLPGHGKSDVMGYVQKMERMADVVKDVLDQLRLRKYVLIGHSMGGYVTMAFAEKYSASLNGFCLFHSSARGDTDEKKADRDRAIKIVKRDPIRYTNQLVMNLFAVANQKYMKKEINIMRRIASKTKVQSIAACLEGMKIRKNRENVLRETKLPVLLIAGTRDVVVPLKALEEQAQLLKNGKLLVLERTGHMGFLEAKEITLKAIQQFCNSCYRKTIRRS